jgi:hypothetical protein
MHRGISAVDKIDTAIRHVTAPGKNLFADLGFPDQQAKRFQEKSKLQIATHIIARERSKTNPSTH